MSVAFLAPASIVGRAYLAPAVPPTAPETPDNGAPITVPASRTANFGGGTNRVAFDGGTNRVDF